MRNTAIGTAVVPLPAIETVILLIRGRKVILDADLARLYGVPTKALNQAVKRNRGRFPMEFMFQLTAQEKKEVVTNCDHLAGLRFYAGRPFAFTEHGAMMAANVLKSPRAVRMSVAIIQTFIRLRQMLAAHSELARKIAALERKHDSHSDAIQEIFHAIKALTLGARERRPARREIGFHTGMASKPESKPPRKRRATTGSKLASHPQ